MDSFLDFRKITLLTFLLLDNITAMGLQAGVADWMGDGSRQEHSGSGGRGSKAIGKPLAKLNPQPDRRKSVTVNKYAAITK